MTWLIREGWSRKDFLPLMVFGLSLCLIHLWFVCFRFQGDTKLLGLLCCLAGLASWPNTAWVCLIWITPKLSHLAYPIGITLMLITSSLFKGSRIVILQAGWLSALPGADGGFVTDGHAIPRCQICRRPAHTHRNHQTAHGPVLASREGHPETSNPKGGAPSPS